MGLYCKTIYNSDLFFFVKRNGEVVDKNGDEEIDHNQPVQNEVHYQKYEDAATKEN